MKLKLLEPIHGYELEVEYKHLKPGEYFIDMKDECSRWNGTSLTTERYVVLTPLKKYVDWKKVDDKVLVMAGSLLARVQQVKKHSFEDWVIDKEWQPHTLGGQCPVDSEAFVVEVMYAHDCGTSSAGSLSMRADDVVWKTVAHYRVVGLAPGYEYP